MLNLLCSFIFYIINFIANTFLAPLLLVLNIFAGDQISTTSTLVVQSIFNFLNAVSNFILFASDILCIPRALFVFVFTIMGALLAFIIGVRTFVFSVAIYRHFKP